MFKSKVWWTHWHVPERETIIWCSGTTATCTIGLREKFLFERRMDTFQCCVTEYMRRCPCRVPTTRFSSGIERQLLHKNTCTQTFLYWFGHLGTQPRPKHIRALRDLHHRGCRSTQPLTTVWRASSPYAVMDSICRGSFSRIGMTSYASCILASRGA